MKKVSVGVCIEGVCSQIREGKEKNGEKPVYVTVDFMGGNANFTSNHKELDKHHIVEGSEGRYTFEGRARSVPMNSGGSFTAFATGKLLSFEHANLVKPEEKAKK